MGDGWVKCEKIYPPKIEAVDNGNSFNYQLAMRGWGADSMTVYIDNISVTELNTMSSQTPDVSLSVSENNTAEYDVFGLEPGRTYNLIVDVILEGEGDVGGNTLNAELKYAAWNTPEYPNEAEIVYKSNSKAKASISTADIGELNKEETLEKTVLVYTVPKDLLYGTVGHKLCFDYIGDNENVNIKIIKYAIMEYPAEITTVPDGGEKPIATPPPTPTPTPTAKPSSAATPSATPSSSDETGDNGNTGTPVVSLSPTATSTIAPSPSVKPSSPVKKSIKFAKKKVTIKKGKKTTLKVIIKGAKKAKFSVDKKGKKVVKLMNKKAKQITVKGKKKGKASITAKITGKKATCKVTVK